MPIEGSITRVSNLTNALDKEVRWSLLSDFFSYCDILSNIHISMSLLLVINYPQELDLSYWQSVPGVDVLVIKESKWSYFALKLQKHLMANPYDIVLHYGICGWEAQEQIGSIYQIERAFLRHESIIDNQVFVKRQLPVFEWLDQSWIVTKFHVGDHYSSLYHFASLYDLETFWVAQLSAFSSVPILSIKWVTDVNDVVCVRQVDEEEEIAFLLDPSLKRSKKKLLLTELQQHIDACDRKLRRFYAESLLSRYTQSYTTKKRV